MLPIVDHNYLATVIAPTQTAQGYTKRTCDMCGDSYNDTFVAPTGKTEGLDYTVNADGTTCTVTGLGGCTGPVINIPSEIDGYTVTAIGDRAFAEKTALTAIYLPETVKTIGTRAFYACSGLSEMTIPASVTSIGTQIFYKCSNLKTVYYNSTYSSSSNPFLNIANIEKVVFGGKYVPSYICQSFTNIKTVEIKDSVTSIGYDAFYGCTSLTTVYYTGTPEEWGQISVGSSNSKLTSAARYYYSETEPIDTTYPYWHYVNGVPTKW